MQRAAGLLSPKADGVNLLECVNLQRVHKLCSSDSSNAKIISKSSACENTPEVTVVMVGSGAISSNPLKRRLNPSQVPLMQASWLRTVENACAIRVNTS